MCEDIGERTRRISAAQRQPANTRSKRAQEMGRQVAQKAIRRCDMDHYKDIEEIPMIFGPRELSKILGISKNKTYEVVNRYDFPKIRVGRRIIISKKHFLEWMDANFGKERNNTYKALLLFALIPVEFSFGKSYRYYVWKNLKVYIPHGTICMPVRQ